MSAVEIPAFASSSIAPAASVAEYTVRAPASSAASRSSAMLSADSIVDACTDDIASSKSANLFTARLAKPTIAKPNAPTPVVRVRIDCSCAPILSRPLVAKSSAAFCAVLIPETKPVTLAANFTATERSATKTSPATTDGVKIRHDHQQQRATTEPDPGQAH